MMLTTTQYTVLYPDLCWGQLRGSENQLIVMMTVDYCTCGHKAVFKSKWIIVYRSFFTSTLLIFSGLLCKVSNLQQQSCSGTITQCGMMRNFLVGKIALRFVKNPVFISSLWSLSIEIILHLLSCSVFSTSLRTHSISTAVMMSFCRWQNWYCVNDGAWTLVSADYKKA